LLITANWPGSNLGYITMQVGGKNLFFIHEIQTDDLPGYTQSTQKQFPKIANNRQEQMLNLSWNIIRMSKLTQISHTRSGDSLPEMIWARTTLSY